jgi:hypothetical protein
MFKPRHFLVEYLTSIHKMDAKQRADTVGDPRREG